MSSEAVNPNPPSIKGERHTHMDREVRDMISALNSRLTNLHQIRKQGASAPHSGDDDEHRVRIITIEGTNTGATMRGELLNHHHKIQDQHNESSGGLGTYVNSNFQAVNSSIVLDATYDSNDPGVHAEIEDVMDSPGYKTEKYGRKGLRKGKEPAYGNPNSGFSD